ncbi:MAG: TlpA family protein disulfide reductase [Bacteroidetes bacterium]|nr:hypothetical protein AWN76_004045 [Rhodothermaceae bacterium RA]RMH68164.1 MAG: TlpA family protein disulfide reductase [Bacteroidota bacterium]
MMLALLRLRAVSALVILAVLAGCSGNAQPTEQDQQTPDFILEDHLGNTFQLSQHHGTPVMLHFFATWCNICQSETPILNELYAEYSRDQLILVGVAVDGAHKEAVEAFAETYQVQYPLLLDATGQVSRAYGVTQTVPVTYFIGKDGVIIGAASGYRSKEEFQRAIQQML